MDKLARIFERNAFDEQCLIEQQKRGIIEQRIVRCREQLLHDVVIGVDLVAIGALAVLPPGKAGWWLSALLMADPVDSARALGLSLFHADVVAGPTGAALRAVLGNAGAWALTGALVGWTLVPLALAGRRFARSDL